MKICRLSTSFAAQSLGLCVVLLAGLVTSGAAYGQAMDGIRVVDIKYLLDNHPRFQAAKTALGKEFDATAKRLSEDRDSIVKLHDQLKAYTEGTPDYKRLDDDISHRQAEWTLQRDRQLKEFRNREAEILANVYLEIQMAVKIYCERNNVGLVFQFNGDPPDSRSAAKIVASINRQLVYNAPNRDITPIIRDMIIRGDVPAPAQDTRQILPQR